MRMRSIVKVVSILMVLIAIAELTNAQCAMCEAVAESASEDNSGFGEGLNNGILYLMFIPYLLFAILGIVFFRKKIVYFYKELSSQNK